MHFVFEYKHNFGEAIVLTKYSPENQLRIRERFNEGFGAYSIVIYHEVRNGPDFGTSCADVGKVHQHIINFESRLIKNETTNLTYRLLLVD
jgi:hypothetical protein